MKYVIIPEPVVFKDRKGEPMKMKIGENPDRSPIIVDMDPLTAADFAVMITSDKAIGRGGEGARRIRKIQTAFEGKKPGELAHIEDTDYDVALKIVENFEPDMKPYTLEHFLPMIEAWEKAKDQNDAWKRDVWDKKALTAG